MYRFGAKRSRNWRPQIIALVIALLLIGGGVWALRSWYSLNLRPLSSDSRSVHFTVESGSTLHQIAIDLQQQGLIRSSQAFETYVRSNQLHDELQAGTYAFSPSMSVQQLVRALVRGDVAKNLFTILPGKRLDQIKASFIKAGYSKTEVEKAFDPAQYADHPALASLPPRASLEGYLYPESFQKVANTPAAQIIRSSLDEMNKRLTAKIRQQFAKQGLTPYRAITLASLVELEVSEPGDRPVVAQVFLKRLKMDMKLESDVTAKYGAALAGLPPSLTYRSVYNTYLYEGLPPTPISNVTEDALRAVAYPAKSDFLFFVSGDDGTTHFSHTKEEHEAATRRYCHKNCLL